ncbi:DUF7344 domain-containing protein [Halorussus salinus]|uniref:DUF7344 domain-containing protein n=1 Tax=Halorussus salinus TaxID=1364935 RepID=UPI0010923491|nr:hypothetical protein [Halorussus salinus]
MSASKDPVESTDTTEIADDATETDETDELTRDDIFHVLQCRRRRLVLKYLQEHDTPVKMTDITEKIAAVEHDTTVAALKSQERQRVYIALYQSHLPKLDEEGIIQYQQNRGIVERTERTDAFDRYLDEEPSMRDDDATEPQPADAERDEGAQDTGADDHAWSPLALGGAGFGLALGGAGFGLALAALLGAMVPGSPVPLGVSVAIAAVTAVALVAAGVAGKFRREE